MTRTVLIALLSASAPSVHSAQWNYCGNTGISENDALFYDASRILRPDKTTVRVWTKAIPQKALDRYVAKHRSDKQFTDKVRHRVAKYHTPKFLALPQNATTYSTRRFMNMKVNIFAEEVIANSGKVQPAAKIYWEINCRSKRYGALSVISFGPNGQIKGSTDVHNPELQYIAPDSVAQWLSQLTCKVHLGSASTEEQKR